MWSMFVVVLLNVVLLLFDNEFGIVVVWYSCFMHYSHIAARGGHSPTGSAGMPSF